MTDTNITHLSPDKLHTAELVYESEIRFGPAFYSLSIDHRLLNNRIFGNCLCWSFDSKYLATQEWLTTDYSEGPITRVLLIDIDRNRFVPLKNLHKGFVNGFTFENNLFVYTRDAGGMVQEVEVNISDINTWEQLF